MGTTQAENTLTTRQREEIVVAVRLRGGTYQEAADAAGYSDRVSARDAFLRAINRLPNMDAKELRYLILDRHEAAYALAWGIAQDTGNKPLVRLQALDRCRAALAESAKIVGAYAPVEQRVTVVTEDAVDAAIAELVAQFPEVAEGREDVAPVASV